MKGRSSAMDLSAKRRALLDALLREEAAGTDADVIPRRSGDGPPPLSYAQERLWFLDQYYPGSAVYNIPCPLPLHGPVSLPAVATALAAIVGRHEALRTTFGSTAGRPFQVILPRLVLGLPVIDLSGLPPEHRWRVAQRLVDADARRPFDLAAGPLLRAACLRIDLQFHWLLVSMHHIVSDGWSMQVFLRELNAFYRAATSGGPSGLPELPIQYADYAEWQRGRLEGPELVRQLDFWRERLADVPEVLALPTDRPRPPYLSYRGASTSFELSPEVSGRLVELSRRAGATLFMTLVAGFQTLLFRHTQGRSVVVGFPTANRDRTELEGLIGFFVNTLVLRSDPAPELPFGAFLARVREATLAAFAHQDLPFEKLVEELHPTRNLNANPIFQVMFDFQNRAAGADRAQGEATSDASGATSRGPVVDTATAKFDLSLSMVDLGGRIGGAAEFDVALFDRTTIVRMLRRFETLLEAAVADPERPLGRLPLMPPGERQQVALEWNDTARPYPRAPTVWRLFEEQVARRPDAVAGVGRRRHWSFGELERRARGLARLLARRGVGRGTVVAICAESSLEMVQAVYGVLAAGAAYLPVDAAYPPERIAFMLRDARVPVVLVQAHLADRVAGAGAEVVALDGEEVREAAPTAAGAGETTTPAREPAPPIDGRDACYVIYTSGSTGRPKGAVIEHAPTINLVRDLAAMSAIGPGVRVLQFASFGFDVSVRELFEPLLHGATLCLESRERLIAGALAEVLERERIGVVTLAPSVWNLVPPEARLPDLSMAFAGGEECPAELVERRAPGRTFFNAYGPTETTVASSVAICRPGGGKPTIGRPLANTTFHVVDRSLEPCSIGVTGELAIGGDGLARGYLRRPSLTAEKFVPDPFSRRPGDRLYRTGDLVRYLQDGAVDYLGRLDFQVKLRGLRIELGEIEAVLGEHPAVATAVVGCHRPAPGEASLIAYLVTVEGSAPPSAEELRLHLVRRLPDYMMPAHFLVLDALPLTAAGKVDRKALPAPEELVAERELTPPTSPLEQVIAEVWAEVLGHERVGIDDNLFELGGHSLLVTQIVSRLRDLLQVEIPIRRVFETPTVAGLAAGLLAEPEVGPRAERAAELAVELAGLDEAEIDRLLGERQGGGAPAAEAPPGAGAPPAASAPLVAPLAEPSPVGEPAAREPAGSPGEIPRRSPDEPVPLSFAQERLWFLDQFRPAGTAYNLALPVPFAGPLHRAALRAAVDELVRRHEILRTVFASTERGPVQVVEPPASVPIDDFDLERHPVADRPAAAQRVIAEQGLRPFDLARGPLLRVFSLHFAPDQHVLVLNLHHILSDAWSIGIARREVVALYEAFAAGRPSPLPELPVQYGDYALWQRRRLTGERLERHLAFWRRRLAGMPPLLDLPFDRPRPPVEPSEASLVTFALPDELARRLLELTAGQGGTTPFMSLLAAFMVLLGRLSGQERVVVGSPIANRTRAELEGLIGFFTNTLALPGDLTGRPGFREVVAQVRETTLEAFAHQELPFEKLVEELNPVRNLSANPLFQVLFVLQRGWGLFAGGQAGSAPAGGRVGAAPMSTAKFDLSLYLEESDGRIAGGFEYAVRLFDRTTIERFAGQLEALLAGVVEAPDRPVEEIGLLRPAERHQLLVEWSRVDGPADAATVPVTERIRRRAAELPDAVAIADGARALTYAELRRRAEELAGDLAARGVPADGVVAVETRRDVESLVALLAVLLAGAAYLPLDPALPEERLAAILADARPDLVLTPARAGSSRDRPRPLPQAPSLEAGAYVVYTSGSTGRPKGIVLPHRTLAALERWQTMRSAPRPRTLHWAAAGFDVALQEVLTTWGAGGTLVLLSEDDRRDLAALPARLAAGRVERLFLPYVALRQLAEAVADLAAAGERPSAPAEIVTAGEQLVVTPELVALAAGSGCRLVNQYGPSESHVVSEEPLAPDPAAWEALPPIGRPAAGSRLQVVDRRLEPVPIGGVGELAVGGPTLARGYLGSPGLTAERFVPDPTGPAGERLYRTGDRVRRRADGRLDFLGRIDDQVKVRGVRVEPGEVEAHLLRHPAVAQAAVGVVGEAGSDRRLVAWVVAAGEPPAAADLAALLRRALPDAMVPSRIVYLDRLPLTATGKLDRRALPSPDLGRPDFGRPYVAPRSRLEERLAAIWSEVLGVERPGVHDDFFALGGHSLLATRIIGRIRSGFGVELPLRRLFEEPTIARLAVLVVQLQAAGDEPEELEQLLGDLEALSDSDADRLLGAAGGDAA